MCLCTYMGSICMCSMIIIIFGSPCICAMARFPGPTAVGKDLGRLIIWGITLFISW